MLKLTILSGAEIHTAHEATNIKEDDHDHPENHGDPDSEIEVMRSVHTTPQRLSMEYQTSSFDANASVLDFNAAIHLSFESIRNSGNDVNATETDSFSIFNMERISINENKRSRVRLKRAFSFPDVSTKRFKSVNLQGNGNFIQHKSAFVQTVQVDFLVNAVTQTEEIPIANIATQTQIDRQVRSVPIQTEETVTSNIEVQTEIREPVMIDSESQTDDFINESRYRYGNHYENYINYYFF